MVCSVTGDWYSKQSDWKRNGVELINLAINHIENVEGNITG